MVIRKISVGPDLKSGAMHYVVGQEVIRGEYKIKSIIKNDEGEFLIYIINDEKEIMAWKHFNRFMPVSVENDISFQGDD